MYLYIVIEGVEGPGTQTLLITNNQEKAISFVFEYYLPQWTWIQTETYILDDEGTFNRTLDLSDPKVIDFIQIDSH